jgi:nuclear cap-binding protein subunit 1
LVKIILLTIPFAMASDPSTVDKVNELLEKTEIVASAPHTLESLVEVFRDETPYGYMSVIGLLQKQLQGEKEKGWKFSCLPRLYFKPDEMELAQHAIPNIVVPETINPGAQTLFPEAFFSVYADTRVEVSPINQYSYPSANLI